MKNKEIRETLEKCNVRYWELAEKYGISPSSLSVKLRVELPESEKLKMLSLICEIAEEKENK